MLITGSGYVMNARAQSAEDDVINAVNQWFSAINFPHH